MSERVYKFDKSEQVQLKSLLSYDPYLDPNLIPKSKEDDNQISDAHAAAVSEDVKQNLKKLSENKYANVIFVRQKYDLREGGALGLDDNKVYLYLSANDEFLASADQLLKEKFKSAERATSDEEQKFISILNEEESRANSGFGMVFGA